MANRRYEEFKVLHYALYNVDVIKESISSNGTKALVHVVLKSNSQNPLQQVIEKGLVHIYDLETDEVKTIKAVEMNRLGLSKNYIIVEDVEGTDKRRIKIIDKDTLNIIHDCELPVDKNCSDNSRILRVDSLEIYNFESIIVRNSKGEQIRYNIHGERLNSLIGYVRINNKTFYSLRTKELLTFDNLEDMRLDRAVKLNTDNGNIEYHIITDTNARKQSKLEQVMFISFIKSGNIYAYSFEDKQIHLVDDSRFKIEYTELMDKLQKCLETSDEERLVYLAKSSKITGGIEEQRNIESKQFEVDKIALLNNKSNKFSLYLTNRNNERYLAFRSVVQCVTDYQREYNGKIINTKDKHDISNMGESEKTIAFINTPYKIKSMQIIDGYRKRKESFNNELKVLDNVISIEEVKKLEGLQ